MLTVVCGGAGDLHTRAELEPSTMSEPLPYTMATAIAVLSDGRVCIIDTYEVQLSCGDREWRQVVRFGREGRGPGEILGNGKLLPLPGGGVAYVDYRNARTGLYSHDLEFTHSVPKAVVGPPVLPSEPDSVLHVMAVSASPTSRRIHRFDLRSGSETDSIDLYLHPEALGRDSVAGYPILRTRETYLVRTTGDNLMWTGTDGRTLRAVIPTPSFDPGYPDSIDVENIRADLRSIFGFVREDDVEKQRMRRRNHYPVGEIAQIDPWNRLWILTNRPHPFGSWFDVYEDDRYIGAVLVRARVAAFRIHGAEMFALTIAPELNADSMRDRHIAIIPIPESLQREGSSVVRIH